MKTQFFPRGYANHDDLHLPIATTTWTDEQDVLDRFSVREGCVNSFLFGKLQDEHGDNNYLSYQDDAGIFSTAASRAGKNVSLIIPNLLSYEGAVFVLDMKGENAKATALWRKNILKQNVVVFDPFSITDFETSTFNPLAYYDPDHKEFVDDIIILADSLIIRGGANTDPHWDDSVRTLFKMLLMYIVIEHHIDDRHLVWLRILLLNGQTKSEMQGYTEPKFEYDDTLSKEENAKIHQDVKWQIISDHEDSSFEQLLRNLKHYDNHIVSGVAKTLLNAGDKERGSILSSANRHSEFLDSERIQEILNTNSFDLSEYRNSSIYLALPENRLIAQSRWLRLMLTLVLRRVQSDGVQSNETNALLMVLDEAATLGYMELLENSMSYIAGYGVKMWTIWQDLNQLKSNFKDRWETFIGNASIFTAFGNVDLTTLRYISERLGKCEVPRVEDSQSSAKSESDNRVGFGQSKDATMAFLDAGGTSGETTTFNRRPTQVISPLLLPEEVGRYFGKQTERILVLIGGEYPIYANRILYYRDQPFKDRAGQ